MTSSNTYPQILHADQEHTGLRTAVFILLFVTIFLAFFAIRALLGALNPEGLPDYAFVLSCGGAFPIALAVVWLAEKLMKRYWPSGRQIKLTSDGLEIKAEDEPPIQLSRSQAVEPLGWYFDLRGWQRGGRERRVPRNWLCLAVELKEGKKQAIIYTYLSPNQASRWLTPDEESVNFQQIHPREVYDTSIRSRMRGPSRPEIPSSILMGKDGNYWLAERRRWQEGFELGPKEFEQFMTYLNTHLL